MSIKAEQPFNHTITTPIEKIHDTNHPPNQSIHNITEYFIGNQKTIDLLISLAFLLTDEHNLIFLHRRGFKTN